MLRHLNGWAFALKRDVYAVYLAALDPRVPWYAKAVAVGVAAYALSPLDLIPDFIPILGYLDDLLIVPVGVWLVIKLIPAEVMAEYRVQAAMKIGLPVSKTAPFVIVTIWILSVAAIGWLVINWLVNSN